MDPRSLSLKRRVLVGFIASSALLAIIGVIVGVQYVNSYTSEVGVQQRLTPAAERAVTLDLALASAAGNLVDYVLNGHASALNYYQSSMRQADATMRELDGSLTQHPQLREQLASIRSAQETWLVEGVTPTLRFMAEGDAAAAAAAIDRPSSRQAFEAMISLTIDFQRELARERNEARDRLADFSRQLGVWLLVLAAGLLGVVGGSFVALNRWILDPLLAIRKDVAYATDQSHTHPISPTGPPELQALAQDAENLRRSLVTEIDEARAARTGLAQDAPLVDQMRAALAPPPIPAVADLSIAGTSQSAEGVLAGDWWDVFPTDGRGVAVVIGDTSGHGTASVITALRTRDLLRGSLRSGATAQDSVRIAAAAFQDDDRFVTAFVALVDVQARTLTYVNAGHPPPVLVDRNEQVRLLEGTGPLLSVLGGRWEECEVAFGPGDVLMAFTDGLLEENDDDGTDLTCEDVALIIKAMDAGVRADAHEVLTRVIAQIRSRSANWQRDDMTAVTIGHSGMAL